MSKRKIIFPLLILLNIYLLLCHQIFENNYSSKNVLTTDIKVVNSQTNDYFAVLKIPKINLTKPLFSKEDSKNNINQNITILKESSLPDQKYGLLILAAHSGTGPHAYFNNINKLKTDDLIYIIYQGYHYTYKIKDIYEEDKNGKIHIKKYPEQTQIILTTCSTTNNQKQLIINGILIEKKKEKPNVSHF